jgi:hypothetical protein
MKVQRAATIAGQQFTSRSHVVDARKLLVSPRQPRECTIVALPSILSHKLIWAMEAGPPDAAI